MKTTGRFCRYELRTTAVDTAREFYSHILGPDVWSNTLSVGALPEHAITRGAVPHWLGHIVVDNLAETRQRFIGRGATLLGPPPDAGVPSVLRDPFDAVVALTDAPGVSAREDRVAWRMLHVKDEADAFAMYGDVFGWAPIEREKTTNGLSEQTFAWNAGGDAAGSIANTASLPGVHAHWMFFFATETLDDTLALVREAGGTTLPIIERPDGSRVAPCEDPQRAAFGLYQRRV